MIRTPNRDIAKTRAAEGGCSYALCVVDGLFYVGTAAELGALPCVIQGDPDDRESAEAERRMDRLAEGGA